MSKEIKGMLRFTELNDIELKYVCILMACNFYGSHSEEINALFIEAISVIVFLMCAPVEVIIHRYCYQMV